ncbi:MAG: hypothetical protein U0359_09670 [Byssovorax sp.]
MPTSVACPRCGAALPLPEELSITVITCRYCGTQQPVPDLAVRHELLEAERQAAEQRQRRDAIQQEVQANVASARRVAKWAMLPGLIAGGIGALVGIIAVVRALFMVSSAGGSIGSIASGLGGWDGKKTLICSSGQVMDFVGMSASLKGTAIQANGTCVLNFTGGQIKADTGISASGNATVMITGATIDAPVAVEASGNATVTVRGCQTTGKVKKSGRATVIGL